ncbi:alpha/beta hydrolase [Kitasatospora sp. NBC_00240]|uniref:alpha/beta hydrolase n=1 Tax=Kitasatospora sp. NBC_00240 TaxID=2903567 RepID=UPI002254F018|nr:alpha/beta hydrolase [Kitasatospora sp. NBC_00240]MCX5215122.1 alpha/beta hydrolase [Kitasatospora sp. NBC_00240]
MAEPVDPSLADAELTAFIEAVRRDPGPPARAVGAVELRRAQRVRAEARPPGPEIAHVEDLTVGPTAVGARLYRPSAAVRALVVFLHGGMWTIGDLESHDRACRRLALRTGAAVLSVDFRRAPEHPWPAAVDDCVDVLRWAVAGGGAGTGIAGPTVVMGDSSGGNLAALACLRLRDEGGPLPAAQILVCPNTDLTLSRPSTRSMATGWGLTTDDVAWGAEQWVPDPTRRGHPEVSPLHAVDLGGLPPTVVITAEHDPLRDEGDAYAARLAAAEVPVRHRREAGMIHGFLTLDTLSPAAAAAGERVFADVTDLLDQVN